MAEAREEEKSGLGEVEEIYQGKLQDVEVDLMLCAVGNHSKVTPGLSLLLPKPGRAPQAPATRLHPLSLICVFKIYFILCTCFTCVYVCVPCFTCMCAWCPVEV